MKFLWMLKNEFKSNKMSTLLIFAEIIFVLVCFCICISLSLDCIFAAKYFTKFDGNSVKAALKSTNIDEYYKEFDYNEIDLAVYVNYYFVQGTDGMTVYLGSYSESAFTDLDLSYSGELVDINKDYDGALPAMVSQTLSEQYRIGETYEVGGVSIYICGKLNDRNLWLMTASLTSENFLMCYDKYGKLSEFDESVVSCGFFATPKGKPVVGLVNMLSSNKLVNSTEVFEWRNKMSEDFDRLSGNLIIGMLVFLISAVGFCANNILTIKNNEKKYYCQFCTGQKKSSIILLFAARLAVCLIAGIFIVVLFREKINIYFDEKIITAINLLTASGLCVILCFISTITLVAKRF